jgi:putative flippase GtrA
VGRRFTRFAFGSVLALAASEATLEICLIAHVWPTLAGASGWFAGALVSYLLSRWAWERRGKPHLLKETLPFWVMAGSTIAVLSVVTSMAHHLALALGLAPAARLAFDGAAYLAANTVTFLARYLILNYVLFADRYPSPGKAGTPPSGGPWPADHARGGASSGSSAESTEKVPAGASAR